MSTEYSCYNVAVSPEWWWVRTWTCWRVLHPVWFSWRWSLVQTGTVKCFSWLLVPKSIQSPLIVFVSCSFRGQTRTLNPHFKDDMSSKCLIETFEFENPHFHDNWTTVSAARDHAIWSKAPQQLLSGPAGETFLFLSFFLFFFFLTVLRFLLWNVAYLI